MIDGVPHQKAAKGLKTIKAVKKHIPAKQVEDAKGNPVPGIVKISDQADAESHSQDPDGPPHIVSAKSTAHPANQNKSPAGNLAQPIVKSPFQIKRIIVKYFQIPDQMKTIMPKRANPLKKSISQNAPRLLFLVSMINIPFSAEKPVCRPSPSFKTSL